MQQLSLRPGQAIGLDERGILESRGAILGEPLMRTEPRSAGGETESTAATNRKNAVAIDSSRTLASLQVDRMVAAWRRGEHVLVEDVLDDHPELGEEAAIRLIYEEVCLRLEAGRPSIHRDRPAISPVAGRAGDSLGLPGSEMHRRPGPTHFPDVGETLSGFRLIWELGRGAAGKVFLAAQPLTCRPPRGAEDHPSRSR